MSDYKRFVAYLYEYHGNTKGENRGFVRGGGTQRQLPDGLPAESYLSARANSLKRLRLCADPGCSLRHSHWNSPLRKKRHLRASSGSRRTYGRYGLFSEGPVPVFLIRGTGGKNLRHPVGRYSHRSGGRFTTDPSVLQDPAPAESADETGSEIPPAFPATEAAGARHL